ncbi:serine/arginine repetitive matrix protein 1-like isoform X2 [Canis lupus familiaris]|uniref:serine/arginine repetitive matrix protein 1-like isoform X2 n=1 Tax=Canis lupus familiaris TaxID=9615 RepID=UPI0018F7DA23|nr:serine/arginine repetitive matrix protein 1-like isoform X2 [Canis lupus familiaris]
MATGFILQTNSASIHSVLLQSQATTNSRRAKRSRVAFALDARSLAGGDRTGDRGGGNKAPPAPQRASSLDYSTPRTASPPPSPGFGADAPPSLRCSLWRARSEPGEPRCALPRGERRERPATPRTRSAGGAASAPRRPPTPPCSFRSARSFPPLQGDLWLPTFWELVTPSLSNKPWSEGCGDVWGSARTRAGG